MSSLRFVHVYTYPEETDYLRVPVAGTGSPKYPLPTYLPDEVEEKPFPRVPKEDLSRLTHQERLLAYGWRHPKAVEFQELPREEQGKWLKAHNTAQERGFWVPEVDPPMEIARRWALHYLETGEEVQDIAKLLSAYKWGQVLDEAGPVMKRELLDFVTSPVTTELMEINATTFSRGNMGFSVAPLSEFTVKDLGQLYEYHLGQQSHSPEDLVIVAYRVYGETGVIRTGSLICSVKERKILSAS